MSGGQLGSKAVKPQKASDRDIDSKISKRGSSRRNTKHYSGDKKIFLLQRFEGNGQVDASAYRIGSDRDVDSAKRDLFRLRLTFRRFENEFVLRTPTRRDRSRRLHRLHHRAAATICTRTLTVPVNMERRPLPLCTSIYGEIGTLSIEHGDICWRGQGGARFPPIVVFEAANLTAVEVSSSGAANHRIVITYTGIGIPLFKCDKIRGDKIHGHDATYAFHTQSKDALDQISTTMNIQLVRVHSLIICLPDVAFSLLHQADCACVALFYFSTDR